jgi:Tol biopolymer transport system component
VSVAFRPSWAPDNNQVAYVASYVDTGGNTARGLYVVDSDDREVHELLRLTGVGASVQYHMWSPDGQRIVLTMSNQSIMTVDVGTGGLQTVVDDGRQTYYPTWSETGRFIYYVRDRNNNEPDTLGGLYVHDTFTGTNRPFLLEGGGGVVPTGPSRVAPDGQLLVMPVGVDSLGRTELFTVGVDGVGYQRITYLNGIVDNPQWSDNSTIFFDFTPGTCLPSTSLDRATWVVGVGGSGVREWPVNFGSPGVQVGFPFAVSRDGCCVAATAVDSTGTHGVIWAMRLDGSGRIQLTLP